jgi:biopolymer transport protein TolR
LDSGGTADQAQREVTVIADKSLPFELVRKVMATCTATTYGKISLAVLQK